ncbi:LysM domain-containing protein [Legionella israelensis]|uniref:LysM domain-containing protein n=1 Tax=Legionella israelensis TaxID=454 RepID=A0AAX1EIA3_9GAMM|nr:LysM domain-containing protein [Legionella israelensis]QBR84891.1 LysM domain-containing protein [Legionella israelensis]
MRYFLLLLCFLLSADLQALTIKETAPRRYIVQYGDTLWGIANCYLKQPWEWKNLWHANPQIKNPDRLYPGDVIILRYARRQPYLKVLPNGTIKLSPHLRPMLKDNAIPPIPLNDIKPFLNESLVMDTDQLTNAPYIVAFSGEHLLGGQGDEVYVKNLQPCPQIPRGTIYPYAIFRQCGPYLESGTNRILGYKASLVGYGELVKEGDPAMVLLTGINKGIKLRDRVLPNTHPEFNLYFEPQAPSFKVKGAIIDMLGGFTKGAAGQVVVIDKGRDAGLKPGDVLGIYGKCRVINDPENPGKTITLPPERIGETMIFRAFSKTSFSLVVRSTQTINLEDGVGNP